MQATEFIPWWVERVVIPAGFTLFGAAIGFAAGRLRDSLDARQAKKAFLKAIRLELLALREQLEASVIEMDAGRERFQRGQGSAPYLAGTLRIVVFSSQLPRLRDLSDPLVIDVIKFYSDVEILRQLIQALNRRVDEYPKIVAGSQVRGQVESEINSTARVLSESLSGFINRIDSLLPKLPQP